MKRKKSTQKAMTMRTGVGMLRTYIACLTTISLLAGTIPASAQVPAGAALRSPVQTKTDTSSYDYVVTDYDVDGTDDESDRDAIQKVLDMVKGADTQMTVYFPAGDYYIDRVPLHVYSNTHIILAQKAAMHRMNNMLERSIIHNTDQNGAMDAVGGYEMSHDITLEGGTWDGGNIAKATGAADLIRFDHARNISIKDCTIKNVYDCHLIEYVGVKNGTISGCTLTGFRYRSGKERNYLFAREAIQLETAWTNNPQDLSDTDAFWANGSVVDGTTCQQVTISNNTLIDLPCGVGQHHYTTDGKYQNKNITISDNTLTCSNKMKYCKTAITCGGMNTITITGNEITGPYRFGIHITEADNVTVSQNTITGSSQNSIMMDGGTVKSILQNDISAATKHGISIEGGSLTALSENTINKPKQNGISIGKGKVGNILKNKISNAGKHGISITGGTIGTGKKQSKGIISSKITNCKQNGISISRKATVSAIHNNTIKGIKNNGISIIDRSVAYWITNNTIKDCKNHGIWNGSSRKKAVLKNNKDFCAS